MAFYECRFRNELENGKIASWHVDIETPVDLSLGNMLDVIEAGDTEYKTHKALFSADQSLNSATIQGMERFDRGIPFDPRYVRKPTTIEVTSTVADAAGTGAGDSMPPNVALVVSLKTNSVGRRFLGKCYTPPPLESVVDGTGICTDFASRATMVQEVCEALESVMAGVPDRDHVVWSVTYDEQAQVELYVAENRVDTQRRRLARLSG